MVVQSDAGDPSQVQAATQAVLDRWDRIDVLVNCAGIAGEAAPIEEQSLEAWDRMLAVDLGSVFYFCRAVIPARKRQESGRIINIASISGKEGNPNMVPYSTAKSDQGAGERGCKRRYRGKQRRAGRDPGLAGQAGRGRRSVSWLASPECSFSTGSCYDISGGRATH
jgi:NADP-dependent 3-hydroxy acid dehydrogenase YdfG